MGEVAAEGEVLSKVHRVTGHAKPSRYENVGLLIVTRFFSLAGRLHRWWGVGESEICINEARRSAVRGWGAGRSLSALGATLRNLGSSTRTWEACGKE